MHDQRTGRRAYGTGSLIIIRGVYFGKWRIGGKQVERKVGAVRKPGTRDGLTKAQAEAKLRKLMADTTIMPVAERITVEEAGRRLIDHLEARGRKRSTIRSYRSLHAAQIAPRLGQQQIATLRREHIEQFVNGLLRDVAPKTAHNALGLLHHVCRYAGQQGWATTNPCDGVERPRDDGDRDIRFLDQTEVESLLRAVPDDALGRVRRTLYLCAAMSGLRRGELIALRWIDVDWTAQRIRVRRNFIEGAFGTPKTRRGSRSVPLADRLGGDLDLLYRQSAYQGDHDLVFANPNTGRPMNGNALLKAFQRDLKHAGVRKVRLHDLRHCFGTRMAAAGVPMRSLQEWLGHRDLTTTLVYADYSPGAHEVDLVNAAFAPASTKSSTNMRQTQTNSEQRDPVNTGVIG